MVCAREARADNGKLHRREKEENTFHGLQQKKNHYGYGIDYRVEIYVYVYYVLHIFIPV